MKPFGVIGINSRDSFWDFWVDRGGARANRFGFEPPRRRRERGGEIEDDEPAPVAEPEQVNIQVFVDGRQADISSDDAANLDEDQAVFFVNTEEDAHALADILARRNPHRKYLTFNTTHVYNVTIGATQRAEFNSKGLLPT